MTTMSSAGITFSNGTGDALFVYGTGTTNSDDDTYSISIISNNISNPSTLYKVNITVDGSPMTLFSITLSSHKVYMITFSITMHMDGLQKLDITLQNENYYICGNTLTYTDNQNDEASNYYTLSSSAIYNTDTLSSTLLTLSFSMLTESGAHFDTLNIVSCNLTAYQLSTITS